MKKLISTLLMMSLLITPSIASDEGENPFSEPTSKMSKSVNYEPLEVESISVDTVTDKASVKPWYKSKRFWAGVTIGTGIVAGIASLIYSLNGGDEDKGGNPLAISPSPIPSVIANMTATITATASATASALYASMTASPSPQMARPFTGCENLAYRFGGSTTSKGTVYATNQQLIPFSNCELTCYRTGYGAYVRRYQWACCNGLTAITEADRWNTHWSCSSYLCTSSPIILPTGACGQQ